MARTVDTEGAQSKDERPALSLDTYAVGLHLVGSGGAQVDHEPVDSLDARLEAYERDILAYMHRDEPPFRTRTVGIFDNVSVEFPGTWLYQSDQAGWVRLVCADAPEGRRRRSLMVTASRTDFRRSGTSVLHIVFHPIQGVGESALNEYDVIKLMKLWEGGEGFPTPGSPAEAKDERIRFTGAGIQSGSLEDLARAIFGAGVELLRYADGTEARSAPLGVGHPLVEPPHSPVAYRVGTLDLAMPEGRSGNLFADIQGLTDSRGVPSEDERLRPLLAVGGIIQGLLGFDEIESEELADVYEGVECEDESLVGFHKGTLVALDYTSQRLYGSPMSINPYLAIPHGVLAHNEERLKRAYAKGLGLGANRNSNGRSRSGSAKATRGGPPLTIGEVRQRLLEIDGSIDDLVGNVFHYTSERTLYDAGYASRGFEELREIVTTIVRVARGQTEERSRRRDVLFVAMPIVLTFLSAVQAAITEQSELLPAYTIPLVVVVVVAIFFAAIRRV
jgi:hypothetical protein